MKTTLTLYLLIFTCATVTGQVNDAVTEKGASYLDLNIDAHHKSLKRSEKLQQKLLKKLAKKENKIAEKLKHSDPEKYQRLQNEGISYDSVQHPGTHDLYQNSAYTHTEPSPSLDTLSKVNRYLNNPSINTGASISGKNKNYDQDIKKLKERDLSLSGNQKLIEQRTAYLKNLCKDQDNCKGILKSITKHEYYTSGKLKNIQQQALDTDEAEARLLEYLQGKEGFSEALSQNDINIPGPGTSIEQLEAMGYQTKRKMNAHLQDKLKDQLNEVKQSIGSQIQDYTDKLEEVKQAKQQYQQSKELIKDAGNSVINKPGFKVNPMRSLPFKERLQPQFNWQMRRATVEGQPAMLLFSLMYGFRHTERLTYGLGISSATGLGHNWNNIKISFEGLGANSFINWQWQYGIGVYAGYERLFKRNSFQKSDTPLPEQLAYEQSPHNTVHYSESALFGITKSYHISEKWSGSFQVLYDIWWKEKGLRTPIQIRFTTLKK